MLWRDTALQINTPSRFIPRFLLLLARARQLLINACVVFGLVATTVHADAVQGCTSAVSAGCAGAAPFQDVIALAGQGTPELALHLLDQQQASIDPQAAEWAAWEKARILIYQQRRDWASVVRRTQTLPGNLPPAFTLWFLTQGAAAQLESGQGAAARVWLLRLIWQHANVDSQLFSRPPWMAAVPAHPAPTALEHPCTSEVPETCRAGSPSAASGRSRHPASRDTCASLHVAGMHMSSQEQLFGRPPWMAEVPETQEQLFGQWRRMVIHSYIVEGRVDDAYTALLRYQQDYANTSADAQTQLLQAHVLLLAERATEAAALLAGTQEPIAAALHLLARLRSGGLPENILQETRQLLAQQPVTASQGLVAVVQAEAARVIGDHERHVEAMEYALAVYGSVTPPAFAGLFNITDDSVWDAYVAYAQVLSNQQQLLMGDFAPWFAMAQSLAEEHPIRARALFAFLAMRADTAETRVRAHQQLVTLLGQLPQGAASMRALYMKLDRFH